MPPKAPHKNHVDSNTKPERQDNPAEPHGDAAIASEAAPKEKLDKMGEASVFVESLPAPVKNRVKALRAINVDRSQIEQQYRKEQRALELKYQQLYAPLYEKRAAIVGGAREASADDGADNLPKDVLEKGPSGVPDFWLTAMQNNDALAQNITERDAEVLKYLRDIRSSALEDKSGFRLEFEFAPNPYFTNAVLRKTYVLLEDGYEPVLDCAEGTEIGWKSGKNVTVKSTKKKQKNKGGKGGKSVNKQEPCDSFFNFFSPPRLPGLEEQPEMDPEEEETIQALLEADYEVGCALRERVIPDAVRWFTGEAASDDGEYEDDGNEDDDDDDDDDGDDDDDEWEDEDDGDEIANNRGGRGKAGGRGPRGGRATGGMDDVEQCKQQ